MRHYITLPKVANQSIIVNFNPIWNGRGGGGGQKCLHLFSFLNIFKTKRGITLPYYDF